MARDTRPRVEKVRHYFHGDVHEDGKRYYNARADTFEPLPAPEPTAIDVERFKRMKKSFEPGRTIIGPDGDGPAYRPEDAPNLYADDPLMRVHHSTFRAALRKAIEEERHKKRT